MVRLTLRLLFGGGKSAVIMLGMTMILGFIAGGAVVPSESAPQLEERLESEMFSDGGELDQPEGIVESVVVIPFVRLSIVAADIGAHLGYIVGQRFGMTVVKIVAYAAQGLVLLYVVALLASLLGISDPQKE